MTPRLCIGCGTLIGSGSRCLDCKPARQRNGWAWTQIKDQVKARDQHRCTFVYANGRRCTTTSSLTVEHKIPIRNGGSDREDNLMLRCQEHRLDVNQYR